MVSFVFGIFYFKNSSENTDSHLKKLVIYSYTSFQSPSGPGQELVSQFQKFCNCRVQLVNAGDAGLIIQRLKLQKETRVDLVIGLDQLSAVDAINVTGWKTLDLSGVQWRPEASEFLTAEFVPYDWAPMTFVYQKDIIDPAQTLDDLLLPRFRKKLSLQDPRMSTPGLQFLLWVLDVKGEKEGYKFLSQLSSSIYRVSPSWTSSYGLFQNKKAKAVFSYMTSPVYHWLYDKNSNVQPMIFKEGHPVQVELMGIPDGCKSCDLAEQFVRFMLTPDSQKILMTKNYMLPAIVGVSEGTPFENLPKFKVRSMTRSSKLIKNKKKIIQQWFKSIGG